MRKQRDEMEKQVLVCPREIRGSSSSRKTLEPPWDFPQPLEAVAVDEDGEDELEESARFKQIIA